jgi:hypothetical protein
MTVKHLAEDIVHLQAAILAISENPEQYPSGSIAFFAEQIWTKAQQIANTTAAQDVEAVTEDDINILIGKGRLGDGTVTAIAFRLSAARRWPHGGSRRVVR